MVIIDRFTKMVRLKATTISISSEEIAKVYWDEIWKLHRGLQFASKFIEEFMKALGTTRQLSTAHYPWIDK